MYWRDSDPLVAWRGLVRTRGRGACGEPPPPPKNVTREGRVSEDAGDDYNVGVRETRATRFPPDGGHLLPDGGGQARPSRRALGDYRGAPRHRANTHALACSQ
jgi:hypothetical protein